MSSAATPIKIIKRHQRQNDAEPVQPAELALRTERQVRRDIALRVGDWIEAWRNRAPSSEYDLRSHDSASE